MSFNKVRNHYERHPYPRYPLLATVRCSDTYALNLEALWALFNGEYLSPESGRILIAGSGSFSPYPASTANPTARITALDLSAANLRRAKLHCLLHRRRNISFLQGDLLDLKTAPGPFHFIDSFGVLHHLDDPQAGLMALEKRLLPAGILRVMVYGRYARREAESIRRAVKMLGIRDITALKQLLRHAPKGSRVRGFLDFSSESSFDAGLADLFLNPSVHTYRIDDFVEMVAATRLKPLLFAHAGAHADPEAEISRLQKLDRQRETDTNIVCYLGLDPKRRCPTSDDAWLILNPSLVQAVSWRMIGVNRLFSRMGRENPPLDNRSRSFLRRFIHPVPAAGLSGEELRQARPYLDAMFLVSYS